MPTCINATTARAMLLGSEHGGAAATVYRVSGYAVPRRFMYTSRGNYKSNISFGIVQLDIGQGVEAQGAYRAILNGSLQNKRITQQQYNSLISYIGVIRPDLDPVLSKTLSRDKAVFDALMSRFNFSKAIIPYEIAYVNRELLPDVNGFLAKIEAKYGNKSIFTNSISNDNGTALAAITAYANKFGNLKEAERYFLSLSPQEINNIKTVQNWYTKKLMQQHGIWLKLVDCMVIYIGKGRK